MDMVFLGDLRIDTVIGIHEHERRHPQTLIFELELGADLAGAARTDDIAETIDYKAVAERLTAWVGESRFQLLEALAEGVAGILMDEFRVRWCRIRITKRGVVRGVRDVGVIIERGSRT